MRRCLVAGMAIGAALLASATGASLEAETAAQAELAEALQMHAEDLLAGNNVEGSTAPAPAPADAAAAAGAPAVGAEDVSLGSKKWKARESIGGRHRMYRGYGRWLNPYEGWPGTTYRYDGSTERGVECGICMTVVDALIKRLGDQFSPLTISQEADSLCPRLGWVFRSGCRWITGTNRDVVTALIMKLTEPIDACKHLQMCPPDAWDLAHMSGEIEFASDKRGARISLGGGPLTAKSFRRPAFPHGRVETAPVGGSLGMGLGMDSLMTGDRYVAVRDEATLLPPGFASSFGGGADPADNYGFLGGMGMGSGNGEDKKGYFGGSGMMGDFNAVGGSGKKKRKGKKSKKSKGDHGAAAAAAGAAPAAGAAAAPAAAGAAPAAAGAAPAAPAADAAAAPAAPAADAAAAPAPAADAPPPAA